MAAPTLSEVFVLGLLRAQIAASLAILSAMALRGPVRRLGGADIAYRLWALVPAAALSSLFPTLAEFMSRDSLFGAALFGDGRTVAGGAVLRALTDDRFWGDWAQVLTAAWLVGAVGLAGLILLAEMRFRRLARLGLAGPAIVGVAAPRLVTPFDYAERFSEAERGFIRRHERAHLQRGDNLANLVIAAVQVLAWFNPLVHVAGSLARLDQEAACDAQVLEGRPRDRRPYAEALLKAHLPTARAGLACAWAAGGRHPLEWRLRLLARPEPTLRRYLAGLTLVGALAVLTAVSVWTLAPRRLGTQARPLPVAAVELQLSPRA
jgi:beta-lactamase regulating signal transducer with metallopeptidase domain